MLEAMVAMVVLGVGILGLAVSQARLLSDIRSSAQRTVAVNLTEDLSNRLVTNRELALTGAYDAAWGHLPAANNCATTPCDGTQRATHEIRTWMLAVQTGLPKGTATVFRSAANPREIGIVVSWLANENGSDEDDRTSRLALLNTAFNANGGNLACPANNHCHLVYAQP